MLSDTTIMTRVESPLPGQHVYILQNGDPNGSASWMNGVIERVHDDVIAFKPYLYGDHKVMHTEHGRVYTTSDLWCEWNAEVILHQAVVDCDSEGNDVTVWFACVFTNGHRYVREWGTTAPKTTIEVLHHWLSNAEWYTVADTGKPEDTYMVHDRIHRLERYIGGFGVSEDIDSHEVIKAIRAEVRRQRLRGQFAVKEAELTIAEVRR